MTKNKKIVVLYHSKCHDGFASAFAAWKRFGDKADYLGINHNDPIPKGLYGKDIYLLDFSYEVPDTKKLLEISHSLTCIDHHESVATSTKMAQHYSYAKNHSGAVLSWKYFHPN